VLSNNPTGAWQQPYGCLATTLRVLGNNPTGAWQQPYAFLQTVLYSFLYNDYDDYRKSRKGIELNSLHSPKNTLSFYALVILVCVILSACSGATEPSNVSQTTPVVVADNNPANSQALVVPADATGLVARVNGVGISQMTFENELARRIEGMPNANPDALAQQILDGLIERELVRQYAREQGITVTLDEARQEVDALKASLPGQAEWENFLTLNGMTEPEMVNAQLELLVTAKVRELLFVPLYGDVNQAHARHIVVRTEAEANQVLAQLQNGGNFEELAQQVSIDLVTRENGGDLGWFVTGELIDARLGEVIFSLQNGAIAGPIPTRIGYHVVQLIETAQRPIEPERLAVLMEATYNNWLIDQFNRANIERFR
jgi:peptidyl-prolyl cis-trans isomerase C